MTSRVVSVPSRSHAGGPCPPGPRLPPPLPQRIVARPLAVATAPAGHVAPPPSQGLTGARVVRLTLVILLVGLVGFMAAYGLSYYRLPLHARVEHPAYRALRPSGVIGNGYGWAAALCMLLNLAYLVRRRWARLRLGPMAVWLDIHVFTGLLATALGVFHSAFQARTSVAAGMLISLLAVAVTGVWGRVLHGIASRPREAAVAHAIDVLDGLRPGLAAALGLVFAQLPPPAVRGSLIGLARGWRAARLVQAQRRVRLAQVLALALEARRDRAIKQATRTLVRASAAHVRLPLLNAGLRLWRMLHRACALLLIAAVILHAAIAWHYGYRWLFQ